MLLPVAHVFLNQSLIQADNSLEQVDCLLAIVNLSRCELVYRSVISLELARLEEWDRVLHKRHCC